MLPGVVMQTSITRGLLATGLVLGLAVASPSGAATGAWSPRSSPQPAELWTRAGLIRTSKTASEIVPAKTPHQAPPASAASARMTLAGRINVEQRQDRRVPSSASGDLAGVSAAHLRTSSAPDRRARSAHLAMLAGIF